jgi:hypothetical protein
MELEELLLNLKRQQDMFLQYDFSPDIGRLSIRDDMINALLEAWEIHQGAYLRRKIIEALGYWGINSPQVKEFLPACTDKIQKRVCAVQRRKP